MPKTQYVFFDLDGTLIDHFEAIHLSFTYVAEQLGLDVPSFDKVVATVGGSVPVTASKLFPTADVPTAVSHFDKRFEEVMYQGARINLGGEWILEELNKRAINCAVFTNKGGEKARQICEFLGLSKWLSYIIGTGDTPTPCRKPEKEFSIYALQQLNAQAKDSLMIGDSPFDEASAKVVNMDCYLVATGSHSLEILQSETTSKVYPDLFALGESVFGFARP